MAVKIVQAKDISILKNSNGEMFSFCDYDDDNIDIFLDKELLQESMESPVDLRRGGIQHQYYDPQLNESLLDSHLARYFDMEFSRRFPTVIETESAKVMSPVIPKPKNVVDWEAKKKAEKEARKEATKNKFGLIITAYSNAPVEVKRLFLKKHWSNDDCKQIKPYVPGLSFDDFPSQGDYWLYRGFLVEFTGVYRSYGEIVLLVREIVLKREKRFEKLEKLVNLEERMKKAIRRVPIPDDVKMFVWQRDQGRCVRCGRQENLEFDHVIPVAKGGAIPNGIYSYCVTSVTEKSRMPLVSETTDEILGLVGLFEVVCHGRSGVPPLSPDNKRQDAASTLLITFQVCLRCLCIRQ